MNLLVYVAVLLLCYIGHFPVHIPRSSLEFTLARTHSITHSFTHSFILSFNDELCTHQVYLAEILAHQGSFQDAGKAFNKAGHVDKAVDMFADLRQWDDAKRFAALSNTTDARELIRTSFA
jgi:hypothetical protein